MLVVGIDIGAELHHVAVVDEAGAMVVKATPFAENAVGYQQLFALLARAGARGGEDLPLAPARSWRAPRPTASTVCNSPAAAHRNARL